MKNYSFYDVDTVMLAEKYGTPLYIMSEDYILDRVHEIREKFLDRYDNTRAFYASKAFINKEMARIMKREALGVDVVSAGELYTVMSVDFPAEDILLHGNSKSREELSMAIDYGVARIIVDSLDELNRIDEISREKKKRVGILFRINPGVTTDTHKYIQTGQTDSKFGVPILDGHIYDVIEKALEMEYIDFKGIHFHIGSQLFGNGYYVTAIETVAIMIKEIKERFGVEVDELNTGGGYGIHYEEDEERRSIDFYTSRIMDSIEKNAKRYGFKKPTIMIEPGRWVVGEAGMTIYKVESTKVIGDIKTYINVDGSMADNPRPSLYDAKYEAMVVNKSDEVKDSTYTIAGRCCESGDLLVESVKLPKVEVGDYIGIFSTGAYNYSMATSYNRLLTPAVVMVRDGVDRLIVKRESFDDLVKNDL